MHRNLASALPSALLNPTNNSALEDSLQGYSRKQASVVAVRGRFGERLPLEQPVPLSPDAAFFVSLLEQTLRFSVLASCLRASAAEEVGMSGGGVTTSVFQEEGVDSSVLLSTTQARLVGAEVQFTAEVSSMLLPDELSDAANAKFVRAEKDRSQKIEAQRVSALLEGLFARFDEKVVDLVQELRALRQKAWMLSAGAGAGAPREEEGGPTTTKNTNISAGTTHQNYSERTVRHGLVRAEALILQRLHHSDLISYLVEGGVTYSSEAAFLNLLKFVIEPRAEAVGRIDNYYSSLLATTASERKSAAGHNQFRFVPGLRTSDDSRSPGAIDGSFFPNAAEDHDGGVSRQDTSNMMAAPVEKSMSVTRSIGAPRDDDFAAFAASRSGATSVRFTEGGVLGTRSLPAPAANAPAVDAVLRAQKDLPQLAVKTQAATLVYSCEWSGFCSRLALTPTVDRCFLSIAVAIGTGPGHKGIVLCNGAAGGTSRCPGKQETIKELARHLGRMSVVVHSIPGSNGAVPGDEEDFFDAMHANSSGSSDVSLDRGDGPGTFRWWDQVFLRGLAAVGAWGIFSCAEKLGAKELSVLSQSLLAIERAVQLRAHVYSPDGYSAVPLRWTVGVFFTSDGGSCSSRCQQGGGAFPPSVLIGFRNVRAPVPDLQQIARLQLTSAGFLKAPGLGRNLAAFLELGFELRLFGNEPPNEKTTVLVPPASRRRTVCLTRLLRKFVNVGKTLLTGSDHDDENDIIFHAILRSDIADSEKNKKDLRKLAAEIFKPGQKLLKDDEQDFDAVIESHALLSAALSGSLAGTVEPPPGQSPSFGRQSTSTAGSSGLRKSVQIIESSTGTRSFRLDGKTDVDGRGSMSMSAASQAMRSQRRSQRVSFGGRKYRGSRVGFAAPANNLEENKRAEEELLKKRFSVEEQSLREMTGWDRAPDFTVRKTRRGSAASARHSVNAPSTTSRQSVVVAGGPEQTVVSLEEETESEEKLVPKLIGRAKGLGKRLMEQMGVPKDAAAAPAICLIGHSGSGKGLLLNVVAMSLSASGRLMEGVRVVTLHAQAEQDLGEVIQKLCRPLSTTTSSSSSGGPRGGGMTNNTNHADHATSTTTSTSLLSSSSTSTSSSSSAPFKLSSGSSQHQRSTKTILHIDGEDVAEIVERGGMAGLLDSDNHDRRALLSSGDSLALDEHTAIVFETPKIASAGPGVLTRLGLVYTASEEAESFTAHGMCSAILESWLARNTRILLPDEDCGEIPSRWEGLFDEDCGEIPSRWEGLFDEDCGEIPSRWEGLFVSSHKCASCGICVES